MYLPAIVISHTACQSAPQVTPQYTQGRQGNRKVVKQTQILIHHLNQRSALQKKKKSPPNQQVNQMSKKLLGQSHKEQFRFAVVKV